MFKLAMSQSPYFQGRTHTFSGAVGDRKDPGLGLPRMGGLMGRSVGPSRDLGLLSGHDTCPNLWGWIPGGPEESLLKACFCLPFFSATPYPPS